LVVPLSTETLSMSVTDDVAVLKKMKFKKPI